jgi:exodeoxyribonuclease VII large subunit
VRLALQGRDVQELALRLAHASRDRHATISQRLDVLRRRLERRDVRRVAGDLRLRLLRADGRLREAALARRQAASSRVRESIARLDALSPLAVLGRGYAVCWTGDHASLVRSAAQVRAGDEVRVTLAHGELSCRVEGSHV